MVNNYTLPQAKEYKLFLVEVDDDDRERVLAARVVSTEITVEPQYNDIFADSLLAPVTHVLDSQTAHVTLELLPRPDGTYFTIENFNEEEEE